MSLLIESSYTKLELDSMKNDGVIDGFPIFSLKLKKYGGRGTYLVVFHLKIP